ARARSTASRPEYLYPAKACREMDESGVLSPPLATRPLGPFPTDERSTISASAAVKGLAVAREDRLAVPRCPQKACLGRSRYWDSPRSGTGPSVRPPS